MSMGRIVLKKDSVRIEVFGENWKEAVDSPLFQEWCGSLDPKFRIRSIFFQSVDFVGQPPNRRVIFIKFKADVIDDRGHKLPGIVFLRGGAVAMLVVLRCEGEEYVVLTQQPRLATGNFAFPEIPAGMLDGSGNFSGVAAKEIAEETGITIRVEDLVDMTAMVYDERWKGIYLSVGLCDEFLRFFLYRKDVTREELEDISGRLTGLRSEGEIITLKVVPITYVLFETPDAKTLVAIALYNAVRRLEYTEAKYGD